MITAALIALFVSSLVAIVALVPSWAPEVQPFGDTAFSLGSIAATGNGYFPIVTLGVCLLVVIGLKVALLAWRVIVFIWEVLPLKAT